MGGNSRNLTAFSLPFAGTTKLYGCTTRPCLKCYPSRMPLKSATTSTTRANPAKGCNNVTCPVAGEITIRQPQAPRSGVCAFSVRRNRSHSSPHRPTRAKDRLAFTLDLWPTSVRVSFGRRTLPRAALLPYLPTLPVLRLGCRASPVSFAGPCCLEVEPCCRCGHQQSQRPSPSLRPQPQVPNSCGVGNHHTELLATFVF